MNILREDIKIIINALIKFENITDFHELNYFYEFL